MRQTVAVGVIKDVEKKDLSSAKVTEAAAKKKCMRQTVAVGVIKDVEKKDLSSAKVTEAAAKKK
jgi:hypothetical protein